MTVAYRYLVPVRTLVTGWSRPRFVHLAALLLSASLASGFTSGQRAGRSDIELTELGTARLDNQITMIEDISTLGDLDARSDGAWGHYVSENHNSVVSKGGLSRVFRSMGPFVYGRAPAPRYAMTRLMDANACWQLVPILSRGPLSERIEVTFHQDIDVREARWIPINSIGKDCARDHPKGRVGLRVAPPAKEGPLQATK